MKKLFIFLVANVFAIGVALVANVFAISVAFSQGAAINTTGAIADPSAMLDVSGTSSGVLINRMTETQRNAILNPALGLQVFNTTTKSINIWQGSGWKQVKGQCLIPVPNLSYNAPVCPGATLNLTSDDTLTGITYSWTGPNGFTSALKNPGIPNVTTAANGIYKLTLTKGGCTSSPAVINVALATAPATPGVIGPILPNSNCGGDICQGSTYNVTFSIPPSSDANYYLWSVVSTSGAIINSGQGTTSMVLSNFSTGDTIKVVSMNISNTCGYSNPSIYTIGIGTPNSPGTINGPTTFLLPQNGLVYSINPVNGASLYTWTVPIGATIVSGQGTTSITVNFQCGASAGNISVVAGNLCGMSYPSVLNVPILYIPNISGPTLVNINSISTGNVYSINPVTNATGYTWTVPQGATITTGQNTTSITVDFACGATSGNITVTANNACGTSPTTTRYITTSFPAPGAITGNTIVCLNSVQTYSISPVTNATSYTWAIPAGATIISGQGTTSISVSVGTASGNITVTQTSLCGTSTPTTLTIHNAVSTFTSSPSAMVVGVSTPVTFYPTFTFAGAIYSWTFSSGTPASSTVKNPAVTWPIQSSPTSFNVTLTVNGCSPSTTNPILVSMGAAYYATGTGATGTIQSFTVPTGITSITIEAWGAQGGNATSSGYTGGKGADMKGVFTVTPGQQLKILVGQKGTDNPTAPSGGGGTFVATSANVPLIVAGGGAGAGAGGGGSGTNASITTSGNSGGSTGASGGTNGNGGNAGRLTGGGGGFNTDGGSTNADGNNSAGGPGKSFLNGGTGGASAGRQACASPYTNTPGGFGGGSGAGYAACGAGGGYSGGGGADGCNPENGGGGGSYNLGINQTNTAGVQSGNGQVLISW